MKKPQIPTNCCGNMCRDCVWNDYFKKMDKYEAYIKKKGITDEDEDPNATMFARLEKQIMEKERMLSIARSQQKFGKNIVLDISKSHYLELYISVLRSMEEYKEIFPENFAKSQIV